MSDSDDKSDNSTILFPLVHDTWASGHVFSITILPFAEI